MGAVIVYLLPLTVGAALLPVWIIMALLVSGLVALAVPFVQSPWPLALCG